VEETEGLSLTISVYACAGIVGIWNVKMWGGALRFLPLVDIGIPLKSYLISVVSNKQSQRIRASNLHTSYFIVNFFCFQTTSAYRRSTDRNPLNQHFHFTKKNSKRGRFSGGRVPGGVGPTPTIHRHEKAAECWQDGNQEHPPLVSD